MPFPPARLGAERGFCPRSLARPPRWSEAVPFLGVDQRRDLGLQKLANLRGRQGVNLDTLRWVALKLGRACRKIKALDMLGQDRHEAKLNLAVEAVEGEMIPDCIAALLALQIEIPEVKDDRLFAAPNGFLECLGSFPRRGERREAATGKGLDAPGIGNGYDD